MGKKLLIGGLIISFVFAVIGCASLDNQNVESRWESKEGDVLQFYSKNGILQDFEKVTLICKTDKTWSMQFEYEINFMGKPKKDVSNDSGDFSGDTTQNSEIFFNQKLSKIGGSYFNITEDYFNKYFTAIIEGEKITFVWNEPEVKVEPLPPFVLTRVTD